MSAPPRWEQTWEGLALPLPGGCVLLNRRGAALVLLAVRQLAAAASRNGHAGGLSTDADRLCQALRTAATSRDMSPEGPSDAPIPPAGAASQTPDSDSEDLLTTTEVARMLTVTPRHVRRLAEAGTFGPIHRAGRMLLIPAAGVTAHRARAGEVA